MRGEQNRLSQTHSIDLEFDRYRHIGLSRKKANDRPFKRVGAVEVLLLSENDGTISSMYSTLTSLLSRK